jgi:putative Ca2+/H+ antiporter (TMEM165/GDT1 family)
LDWKLFASTFAAVFVAEMGDKTQIATFSLAGSGSSRWTVFAGSALALVCTSAIAVALGEVVSRTLPPVWIKRAAGVIFVALGILYIVTARAEAPAASGGAGEEPRAPRITEDARPGSGDQS